MSLFLLVLFCAIAIGHGAASAADSETKSVVALPEFGGQCPAALAEGKRMQGDCSITWADKDGKLYCFADAASRADFLKDPETRLKRAREFYAAGSAAKTALAMSRFQHDDDKNFVIDQIKTEAASHGGVYLFHDRPGAQDLQLVFDKIDFMRTLDGYGFFPEAIFHAKDSPDEVYDLDFWVEDRGGAMTITDVKVHKVPEKQQGGNWVQVPRYSFDGISYDEVP